MFERNPSAALDNAVKTIKMVGNYLKVYILDLKTHPFTYKNILFLSAKKMKALLVHIINCTKN